MGIFELATVCRFRARSRRGEGLCHCMEERQDHRRAAADAIATVCDCGKSAFKFNERG
jgi:hypothetical protein